MYSHVYVYQLTFMKRWKKLWETDNDNNGQLCLLLYNL